MKTNTFLPKFYRFSELTRKNVLRDFQIHTNWTDGDEPVSKIVQRATEIGLSEIAFTEHARNDSTYYPAFFREITNCSRPYEKLRVYKGFEVKILDTQGALDISAEMRSHAELVLGSVHSLKIDSCKNRTHPKFLDYDLVVKSETDLSLGLIENGGADVLSHPGGMSLKFHGNYPMEKFDLLLSEIKNTPMAFEINYAYHKPIINSLLDLVSKHDPFVSIGSDVHQLPDLGKCSEMICESMGL